MASVSIVKIKIRRGTDAERQQITLDNGELGYVTDTDSRRVFIGDGVTKGGVPVGIKFFNASLSNSTTYKYAAVGDLLYDNDTSFLYSVTAIDTSSPLPFYYFKKLNPATDNTTIQYGAGGLLRLVNAGITETYISNTTFTNGITGGAGVKIGVNYDNNKITYTSSKLTVNENALLLSAIPAFLPTSNPGPNKLWSDLGTIKMGF